MTKREEVLVALLERYGELVDPMQARGDTGDGVALPLMPRTYTPSVRELERLLHVMRDERRSQWWHVTERYLRCQQVTRDVSVKRKAKNGRTVTVIERQLVTEWNPAVRAEKVRRGVAWLAASWARESPIQGVPREPMLPQELMAA